jgi:hypothetical protein
LERQRRLARRLRAVDLDDAAARDAADAEGVVDADRAGGDGLHGDAGAVLAEAHDRALAELLFNLADGDIEGLVAFLQIFERHVVSFGCEGHPALVLSRWVRRSHAGSGLAALPFGRWTILRCEGDRGGHSQTGS